MTAALEADSLYRFFHSHDEETLALRGVSIIVEPGEFVVVNGPSGSGKSTLLSCLAGLDEPDGGTVRVGGVRISRRSEIERARVRARRIGILAQHGNMTTHLTVMQNLDLVSRLAGRRRHDGAALLAELGVASRAGAFADELSGGETVRVGLAMALVTEPAVLLADEPTGELDETTEAQVLQLMRERAEKGSALLVASHSRAVAAMADRVVTLTSGSAA